jgi:hypothetical protein
LFILGGIKYSNVFFAEIFDEIIKKAGFDEMILLDGYLIAGFWPFKRGTIECNKYNRHYEKLRIKSINWIPLKKSE